VTVQSPTEPLYRRNGWVRGLIHFHTRFSDGWGTVRQAAEIARRIGFDFLIVTDHLRNLKLKTHRTLAEYIAACDRASQAVKMPVIPGGEIEIDWERPGVDQSQAHTIVFSIRSLAQDPTIFDWTTPGKDPFWHWRDEEGKQKTVAAVQQMLAQHGLPRAASHQFQHSFLGTRPDEHPDFRYDLLRIPQSDYLDFFYSGAVDVVHESEDIELIQQQNLPANPALKAVYASCDYHVGPEVVMPALDAFVAGVPFLRTAYRWLFCTVTSTALRWIAGDPEQAAFPLFAAEQLTHATYVHIGDRECTEESILGALRRGRTCVTRGTAEFAYLYPPPDLQTEYHYPAELKLELPRTWRPKYQRPHHVIVLRDGNPAYFEPYDIRSPDIAFSWVDKEVSAGTHVYQLYVPSKFLGSPIRFAGRTDIGN